VTLKLYNTLTRRKDDLVPIDPANVRMYVCGPTVYDFAHIGNARPVVVFDVLFRLLRHFYGAEHVTYARNITDVDDKINARAASEYPALPSNEAIARITALTTAQFHRDIAALGALPPTVEPTCTGHIGEMVAMIEVLIAKGAAYAAEGHVLLDTTAVPGYGRLSGRSLEEMIAGARVEVAPYKRNPADSVLWKPSTPDQPGWESPWGRGRPGWHIECSAMAAKHLGQVFDIHGGGIDLVFPHHENELAQSCTAHGTEQMASIWMHNGFLQVEGEKMSKSLGNFVTIDQLLSTEEFGGQRWPGKVVRWAMLATHYRQPIDWTVERLSQARATLVEMAELLHDAPAAAAPQAEVVAALADDLNTPSALSILHGLAKSARRGNAEKAAELRASLALMGLYDGEAAEAFAVPRTEALDTGRIEALVAARLEARKARDFKESDRLRDELVAMGVRIKDGKDASGAPTTTWEPAR
jgi:cysteinyl-tRNA synthetase